ncbi:hypothetical protein F2Q65_03950 [Thiohalocapsa marina]|uniref:YtxH domain-containing protein n=1 Tax=Thiohalocapsa marina TaxID=424902 RepID=A0A5M8FTA7_9GAMM|nr:YtxH domain-containing protein [Thiohalocapsa marina]KAA6187044.1 hypothetical protein F2Q65_03950 [Thiohalocapsa marina]
MPVGTAHPGLQPHAQPTYGMAAHGMRPQYMAPMPQPHYPPQTPGGDIGQGAGSGAGLGAGLGAGMGAGAASGHQAGMAQMMDEIANGGSGLASLSKLLNLEDTEFWKGALVGAAAVLLLTNDSVQNMLFKGGVKAKDAVKTGAEKVKDTASSAAAKLKP